MVIKDEGDCVLNYFSLVQRRRKTPERFNRVNGTVTVAQDYASPPLGRRPNMEVTD